MLSGLGVLWSLYLQQLVALGRSNPCQWLLSVAGAPSLKIHGLCSSRCSVIYCAVSIESSQGKIFHSQSLKSILPIKIKCSKTKKPGQALQFKNTVLFSFPLLLQCQQFRIAGPLAARRLGSRSQPFSSHWEFPSLLLFPDRAYLGSTVNTPIHSTGCHHEMAFPSQKHIHTITNVTRPTVHR